MVRLTAQGQALIQPAREIVAAVAAAEQAVTHAGQGVVGKVTIGFAGPSTHSLISTLAHAVRAELPGVDLTLSSTLYGTGAIGSLRNGDLDLAIVIWDATPVTMRSRMVSLNRYRIVVPENHRLADRERVAFDELADEPWVFLPSSGSLVREQTVRKAEAAGFVPRVAQEAPDSWTVMALVAAGVGITMTIDTALHHGITDGLKALEIVDDEDIARARLIWRTDDANPALAAVLRISERVLPTPPR